MGTMTLAPSPQQQRPVLPARAAPGLPERWLAWLRHACGRVEVWYAGFAVYAAGMALFSGPGEDHYWGIWASGGYAAAAALAWRWPSRRGRVVALATAAAGALAAPTAWLTICAPATPEAAVVSRA